MLDAKGKTSRETLPTHISDAVTVTSGFIAEHIFVKAKEKLELGMNCVSTEFKVSFVKSIVDKLSDTIKSQEFAAILEKHNNNNNNGAIMTAETIKFVACSCIDIILNNNQSVYKKMYINDLLEQFDKFDDPENLDKFFKICQLLKREISSFNFPLKECKNDLTDEYYKKLIRIFKGDKKNFTDFCEKKEGKLFSRFEKIAYYVIVIVFGRGWGWCRQFVCPLETKRYKHYLQDKYWKKMLFRKTTKTNLLGIQTKLPKITENRKREKKQQYKRTAIDIPCLTY